MPIKLSIITINFNNLSGLQKTMQSVFDQTWKDYEYIIIDGGSTDGSKEFIEINSDKINYWVSEPDMGQADAISKGFELCTGDVFNWLNADDSYTPIALSTVGEYFKDTSLKVLAARSRVFGLGSDFISTGTDIYPGNLERTVGRARIDQPATFFRLDCIRSIGGINKNLHYLMDRELWIRYLIYYGIESVQPIDAILVNFRLHALSKSVSERQGFDIELNIINDLILSITNQDHNLFPSSNSKSEIVYEWFSWRYELAYANRDWFEMDRWKALILKYHLSLKSLITISNLEWRRIIHHLLYFI